MLAWHVARVNIGYCVMFDSVCYYLNVTCYCVNHRSWTNASHYFRTTYESAGLAELEDVGHTQRH